MRKWVWSWLRMVVKMMVKSIEGGGICRFLMFIYGGLELVS